eukprot:10611040-Lingulodinium_polyedra.AAC.1
MARRCDGGGGGQTAANGRGGTAGSKPPAQKQLNQLQKNLGAMRMSKRTQQQRFVARLDAAF